MSDDGIDVKEILKRLDDLTRVLKIIADDLAEVTKALKAYVSLYSGEKPASQAFKMSSIDDIRRFFPQDLLGLLLFEVTDDYIIIRPKQYLGPENFARVASIVRDHLGGEYVSHGKNSHFRILRKGS